MTRREIELQLRQMPYRRRDVARFKALRIALAEKLDEECVGTWAGNYDLIEQRREVDGFFLCPDWTPGMMTALASLMGRDHWYS
jgi:phosphoserine phosphatase